FSPCSRTNLTARSLNSVVYFVALIIFLPCLFTKIIFIFVYFSGSTSIINQATKISFFIILFTTLTASIIINIFVTDFEVILIVNAHWIVGLLSFFIVL
ncbi:MAG: hypothetical protein N2319_06885, partial [Candidatus Kapabacteria bacterium]|nr:hypothetical protein [Candidatus Kapabacteria bacterium]